jgi:hypothetical protein
LLDDARTVVVSCAAVALGTTEAAWTSFTGTATLNRAMVFVTTVDCGATAHLSASNYPGAAKSASSISMQTLQLRWWRARLGHGALAPGWCSPMPPGESRMVFVRRLRGLSSGQAS